MGPIALFGGYGEFDAALDDTHRLLLDGATGDGSIAIVEFGHMDGLVAPDLACYRRLGVPATVFDVADATALKDAIIEASCVFLHGGNPSTLASTLTGSSVWSSISSGLARGMALAATSGGVMCLGRWAVDLAALAPDSGEDCWHDGLRLLGGVLGAHWNAERYREMNDAYLRRLPDGAWMVAIAERTGLIVSSGASRVVGDGVVVVHDRGRTIEYGASSGPTGLLS